MSQRLTGLDRCDNINAQNRRVQMKCPSCGYAPESNDHDYGDYVAAPGRFYELALEMKQEANPHSKYDDRREALHGCPSCGVVFINVA